MLCHGTNARGEPCASHMADASGYCPAHRAGGHAAIVASASLGGQALRAKLAGSAFTVEELPPLETLEDAKHALDVIRTAVMTRRLTHAEGNSAARAVGEWVKTEGAASTARIVGELRAELEAKAAEIAVLRRQLEGGRPFKVSNK